MLWSSTSGGPGGGGHGEIDGDGGGASGDGSELFAVMMVKTRVNGNGRRWWRDGGCWSSRGRSRALVVVYWWSDSGSDGGGAEVV